MTRGTLRLSPGLRTRAGRTRARTPGQGQAQSTSPEQRHQHYVTLAPPISEVHSQHVRPRVALIIWHIMDTGKPYHELGAGYFASLQDPERETRRLIAKLQALGHTVTLNPAA
jgi:hypothetical protein